MPAEASSSLALALLLRPVYQHEGCSAVEEIGTRLRLSKDEIETMKHVLEYESTVRGARAEFWPTVQRVLVMRRVAPLLDFAETLAATERRGEEDVEFCRDKLALPEQEWNPPTLINGNDLHRMGLRSGPQFKQLLDGVRDRQLMGELNSSAEAEDWVRSQLS